MTLLRILMVLTLAISVHANAGDSTAWQFVYVVRSSDLGVRTGSGNLAMGRDHLSGKLVGDNDVAYYFDGRLREGKVTAHFGAVESDDGGSRLTGTFRQAVDPGSGYCWQTMQLSDGFSSLSLARNVPRCEP